MIRFRVSRTGFFVAMCTIIIELAVVAGQGLGIAVWSQFDPILNPCMNNAIQCTVSQMCYNTRPRVAECIKDDKLPPADLRFEFTEGSGSTATSVSDTGAAPVVGTLAGSPPWVAGYGNLNYAIQFSGTGGGGDDKFDVPALATPQSQISFVLWAKHAGQISGTSIMHTSVWTTGSIHIILHPGNGLTMHSNDSGEVVAGNANSGIFPSDNVWRHLAFTFKQNGNMNIYVAGSLQATSATVTSTFATQTMQWGHYVGTRRFDGVMDEIEVYLTELSASQVAALAAK